MNSIIIEFTEKEDYYNTLNKLREFTENNVRVSGTSRSNEMEIVLEKEEDMEDKTRANK